MGILYGQVTDKTHQPVSEADVVIMDRNFQPTAQTQTTKDGHYRLTLPDGHYPFFVAVKDYGVNGLEYWCHDLLLAGDLALDCQIDKLEIYGLNLFAIKGAGSTLSIYFRPMSLEKFQAGDQDIAPDITAESLTVLVNNEPCKLLVMNPVKEYTSDGLLTGWLIQVARPEKLLSRNKLDLRVVDAAGNLGMGSLFFDWDAG